MEHFPGVGVVNHILPNPLGQSVHVLLIFPVPVTKKLILFYFFKGCILQKLFTIQRQKSILSLICIKINQLKYVPVVNHKYGSPIFLVPDAPAESLVERPEGLNLVPLGAAQDVWVSSRPLVIVVLPLQVHQ